MLIYIHCWELMKTVGCNGSSDCHCNPLILFDTQNLFPQKVLSFLSKFIDMKLTNDWENNRVWSFPA